MKTIQELADNYVLNNSANPNEELRAFYGYEELDNSERDAYFLRKGFIAGYEQAKKDIMPVHWECIQNTVDLI